MGKIRLAYFGSEIDNKGQTIQADEDGYYCGVNMGALNVCNTSGIFYRASSSVMNLFTKDSIAVKRVRQKQLYGENNHPEETEEMREQFRNTGKQTLYLQRQLKFDMDRLAIHIRSFELIETDEVDKLTGLKKILIRGDIKPHGPFKQTVIDAMENPDISCAFSVRSLVTETIKHARTERNMIALVTWDFVLSPGIKGSTDHGSMGLELDASDLPYLIEVLEETKEASGRGNEAEDKDAIFGLETVINELKCDISDKPIADILYNNDEW